MPVARRTAFPTAYLPAIFLLVACSTAAPGGDASPADASDGAAPADASDDAAPLRAPLVPLGFDAYRRWADLPYVRLGVRTYMRSTFDRAGGNEGVDASHFLRFDTPSRAVVLDVAGAGYLEFVRTNHWHGSPWHYGLDGVDNVVAETTTPHPNMPTAGTFEPDNLFPAPLAFTWAVTRGADLMGVPLGFTHTLSLAYENTHYGTGYYIYTLVADPSEGLTQPVTPWDGVTPPPSDVLDLVSRAGEDLAPTGAGITTTENTVTVPANGAVTLADLTDGPRMLRVLRLTVPRASAVAFAHARLRVTWDRRDLPSIDAPVGLFYGTGSLFNRANATDLVRAFVSSVHFDADTVTLSSYFPMPYFSAARVELVGGGEAIAGVHFHARSEAYTHPAGWAGYFHATYRDHPTPTPGRDLVFLDTTAEEGGGDYCGVLAGTSFVFSDRGDLGTLEGDPRFYFDDSETPQVQGTGSEEWGGGGDYWGGETMTLPFYGHPVGTPSPDPSVAMGPEDLIESEYRFLVPDAMPFGRNARVTFEHGGEDASTQHYQSVVYWYGRPDACLVPSDSLDVGDVADEARHEYDSPIASAPETLTSRYELGVDHDAAGNETVPEVTDTGRHTTGTTEFRAGIAMDNEGVLLRRTLDLAYGDQRAEVWVATDPDGTAFERAGEWYTAGSNQCVFSDPPDEGGLAQFNVETSTRRFRDDEFLVPARLTRGHDAVRIQLRFIPGANPLYPDGPTPASAWSEFRYRVYSWIPP